MSEPFESFERSDRARDALILESWSLRKLFVWLLVLVGALGAVCFQMLYDLFRHHHIFWDGLINLPLLGIFAFRYARLIYRHLPGKQADLNVNHT